MYKKKSFEPDIFLCSNENETFQPKALYKYERLCIFYENRSICFLIIRIFRNNYVISKETSGACISCDKEFLNPLYAGIQNGCLKFCLQHFESSEKNV